MEIKPIYLAGAAALIAVVYFAKKAVAAASDPANQQAAAAGAVSAALGVANNVAAGTVKGIGSVFGIPDTNMSQCQIDQANGDTWAASFSCPAGQWLSGVANAFSFTPVPSPADVMPASGTQSTASELLYQSALMGGGS